MVTAPQAMLEAPRPLMGQEKQMLFRDADTGAMAAMPIFETSFASLGVSFPPSASRPDGLTGPSSLPPREESYSRAAAPRRERPGRSPLPRREYRRCSPSPRHEYRQRSPPRATISETLGRPLPQRKTQAGANVAGILARLCLMLPSAGRDPPQDGELRRPCLPLARLHPRRLSDPMSTTTPHRVRSKWSLRGVVLPVP